MNQLAKMNWRRWESDTLLRIRNRIVTHCHEHPDLRHVIRDMDSLYNEDILLDLQVAPYNFPSSEIDRMPRGCGMQVDLQDRVSGETQLRIFVRFTFGLENLLQAVGDEWAFSAAIDAETLTRNYQQLEALANQADADYGPAKQVIYGICGHEFESRNYAGATLLEYCNSDLGFRIKGDGITRDFEQWISPSEDAEILDRLMLEIQNSTFNVEEIGSVSKKLECTVDSVERIAGMLNNGLSVVEVEIENQPYKALTLQYRSETPNYVENCLAIQLLIQERERLNQQMESATNELNRSVEKRNIRLNADKLARRLKFDEMASVLDHDKAMLQVKMIYDVEHWTEIGVQQQANDEEIGEVEELARRRREEQEKERQNTSF